MLNFRVLLSLFLGFSGLLYCQVERVEALNLELRRFASESLEKAVTSASSARQDIRQAAASRAEALLELIQSAPRRALDAALPATTLARLRALAPELGPYLEEHGSWAGRAELAYEDAPDLRASRRVVSLAAAGASLEVFFARSEPRGLATGVLLTAQGIRLGVRVAAARATVIDFVQATSCSTTGEQRIAVLMVGFPGQPDPEVTADQMRDYFFGAANASLDGFWRENSYGKTSASGDVFGWLKLDRAYDCSEYASMRGAAIRAADGLVDFTRYTRVFIFFPRPAAGCGWAGRGTVGCASMSSDDGAFTASLTWIATPARMSSSYALDVAVHEAGHNLGLGHSQSRDYGEEALGALDDAGKLDEYGDTVSIMGSGSGHYAAQHKRLLGWLGEDEIATIETSGEQTIRSLADPAPGIKAVKIRRAPGTEAWLWLEYHQSTGKYESQLAEQTYSGAVIRYDDLKTFALDTHLLDFTPGSEDDIYDFWDPALSAGRSWFDPYSARTLYVLSASPTELEVRAGMETGCLSQAASSRQHGPGEETGTIDFTGASDCAWQAVALRPWITLEAASGTGSGSLRYRVAANPSAPNRTGVINVGRQVFTITQLGIPAAPEISGFYPRSGSGPYADLLASFSDPNGVEDLSVVRVNITGGGQANGCLVEYDVAAKSFRLANDAGAGWVGPVPADQFQPIENSQCRIVLASAEIWGSDLDLSLGIQLKATTQEDRKILVSATDQSGLEASWKEAAIWTVVPNSSPVIGAVVPSGSSGMERVFHVTATDGNGPYDILAAVLQIGASLANCQVTIVPQIGLAGLNTDDGKTNADMFGFGGVLENSQCALDLAEVDYYTSGNELRVRIPLRFKESFAGTRAITAAVIDYSEAVAETQAGTWTVGPATEPAPAISADGVVNAASSLGGAVAPGEIVAIKGANLGPREALLSGYEGAWLQSMVANTEVFFDGVRAPLIHTFSGQVAAIVPYFVSGKTKLRVEYEGRRSNEVELAVADCAPGIFTVNMSGSGPAVAVNERGGLNSAENPAERGTILSFWMTGEGRVRPSWPTGRLPAAGNWPAPVERPNVVFGEVEGQIDFIGLVYAGVTQVNVRIPANAPAGAVPLVIRLDSTPSAANVTVHLR